MEPFFSLKAVAALALLIAASAPSQQRIVPASPAPTCASTCRPDARFVRFDPQKAYVYRIRTQTLIEGAQDAEATPITLEGAVIVQARAPCDLALQLEGVTIGGVADGAAAQAMAAELESSPLVLGYSDGHVTDVCAPEGQSTWSLDVKKSVASALQMTATSLHARSTVVESDVLGACDTEYEPLSARFGKTVIRKIKRLAACSGAQQWSAALFPSSFPSAISALPLVRGQQQCDQSLEADVITAVTCQATNQLAYNAVQSMLNLRLESARAHNEFPHVAFVKHAPILKMSAHQEHEELTAAARDLCQSADAESAQRPLEAFERVIRGLKSAEEEESARALKTAEECGEKAKDLFVDALAMSGSSAAVKTIFKLWNKQKNSARVDVALRALAYAQEPSSAAVEALQPILEAKEAGSGAILGITGFIHNAKHALNGHVDASRAIKALLARAISGSEEGERVIAIKGLENIGLEENESARQQMARIAKDTQQPESARVAAIKALQRASNQAERAQLVHVLEDARESDELRIRAYKAIVMGGASQQEMTRVRQIVEQSGNDDLKQFARAHQKNLRETSDPHKSDIWRKINSDKWAAPKSSWGGANNFEGSFLFDPLGVGAVFEADVIPAHALIINVSLPVFGRQISVFEADFRYAGQQLERHFRSVAERVAKEPEKIFVLISETISSFKNSNFEISLKSDGKTLFYYNSRQKNSISSDFWPKIRRMLTGPTEAALGAQPISARLQLPSTNGWPLILRVNASLVARIQSEVNKNKAFVAPSIGWRVEAALDVRAHQQKKSVGVALEGEVAPEWDSRHEISDKGIKLKINANKEKVLLFRTEAKVFGTENKFYSIFGQNSVKKCSQWTQNAFGIQICFNKNGNGIEIFGEKSDKSLTGYELELSRDRENMRVLFNTPNSRVDRRVQLDVQYALTEEEKSARLNFRSPFSEYKAHAQIKSSEREHSALMALENKGQQMARAELALEQQSRGQKREFRPQLKVTWRGKELIGVSGTVGVAKGRKNALQIQLEGNQKQFLKGSFVREGDRKSPEVRVVTELALQLVSGFETRLSAVADKAAKHVSLDVTAEYRMSRGAKKETIKSTWKVQNLTQSQTNKMSAFAELTSTQFPYSNAHVAYNVLQKPWEHVENELTVQWGRELKNKVHVLQLTKTGEQHVDSTLQIEATPLQVNYELRASGQKAGDQQVQAELQGKDRTGNATNNDFRANFLYKQQSRAPLHLTLNANLKTAARAFDYADEVKEQRAGEYKGASLVTWETRGVKKTAKMAYEVKNKAEKDETHRQMALNIETPFHALPIKHKMLLKMARAHKHVQSALSFDGNEYEAEALLSRQEPSRITWRAPGYHVRAVAAPFHVPSSASVEIVTPSGEHKTHVQVVPRSAFKIKSDTKNALQRNVFALDSEISGQRPSKVHVTSGDYSARFDADLLSRGEKSARLQIDANDESFAHQTAFQATSGHQMALKSVTQRHKRPLVTLDSQLNSNQKSFLALQIPEQQTAISGLYERTSGAKSAAKVKVTCGDKFKHESQWQSEPEVTQWSTLQTDFRSGLPVFSMDYNGSGNERRVKAEVARNWLIDGALTGSEAQIGFKGKREAIDHKSKMAFGGNKYQFSSETLKNGINLAKIGAEIHSSAVKESSLNLSSDHFRSSAQIASVPSQWARVRLQSEPRALDHVTSVEFKSPKYSFDSNTRLNHVTYALAAQHVPRAQSFASFKSPEYELSGHVDLSGAPTAKVALIGPQESHVTHVVATPGFRSYHVESKGDRKSDSSAIYRLDADINADQQDQESSAALKINGARYAIKGTPFSRAKRSVHVQVEHPDFGHVTEAEHVPLQHVAIRSRTTDVSGANIGKVDAFLASGSPLKSHVTLTADPWHVSAEYEPQKSARFDFKGRQWTHVSSLEATPSDFRLNSKTTCQEKNVAHVRASVARELNDESELEVISPKINSKLWFKPKEGAIKATLEAPSRGFSHVSSLSANQENGVQLKARTLAADFGTNELNFDSTSGLTLKTPNYEALSTWSPQHAQIDFRSKLARGRHVLMLARAAEKNGFHAEVAWDMKNDPNQKVIIDWSARREDGTWQKKTMAHVLGVEYAGNALKIESIINVKDVINGPHEWRVHYTPKYEAARDQMALVVKHVIKNGQMACELSYSEAAREKLFVAVKSALKDRQLVASVNSRAPNKPELEISADLLLKAENNGFLGQLKATRLNQRYSYEIQIDRKSDKELTGSVDLETPSGGKKNLKMKANLEKQEIQVALTGSDDQKAELKARARSQQNEAHATIDLTSNIDPIPSIIAAFDYIAGQELSARADVNGKRVAEVDLRRTGSAADGQQVTGSAEISGLLEKIDSKAVLKKSSEEFKFEINSKYDSKPVFAALISGEKHARTWQGKAVVSQGGAQMASAQIDSQSDAQNINYEFSAKTKDQWFQPISAKFALDKSQSQPKLSVSACSGKNTCLEFNALAKKNQKSDQWERANIKANKFGDNFELIFALNEKLDSISGNSLLSLTSGRSSERNSNEISFSFNENKIGFQTETTKRARDHRDDHVIAFLGRKRVQMKSDFLKSEHVTQHVIKVEDNQSGELLENEMRAQISDGALHVRNVLKGAKIAEKVFDLKIEKTNEEKALDLKAEMDFGSKNALFLQAEVTRQPEVQSPARTNRKRRFFSAYSSSAAFNHSLSLNLFSKNRKLNVALLAHASSRTAGLELIGQEKRALKAFVQSEAVSENEQRIKALLETKSARFDIEGALQQSEREISAIWTLKNARTGTTSEQNARITDKCATWQSRGQNNRKLELCLNDEQKDRKSLQVNFQEIFANKKSGNAALELSVISGDRKSAKLDFTWTPEAMNTWSEQIRETSGSYDQMALKARQMAEEGSQVLADINSDIFSPIFKLFSEEFSDSWSQISRDFRFFDSAIEYTKSMLEAIIDSIVSVQQWINQSEAVQIYDKAIRSARKQCKRSQTCYQLFYGLKNYGIGALSDWLNSNAIYGAKSAHSIVISTSGRLLQALPDPQWLRSYRQSIADYGQSIIESNANINAIYMRLRALWREITKDWQQIDAKRAQQLFADLVRTLVSQSNESARRVFIFDPISGKLSAEIKFSSLARAKRSAPETEASKRMNK